MSRWRSAAAVLLAMPAMVATLTACAGEPHTASVRDGATTTLTVFAAASLGSAFEEVAGEFEAAQEGVEVQLNLAGSSGLAAQIREGAPADVFASADPAGMDLVAAQGLLGSEPADFAANTLLIAVPPGNPAGVQGLADLTGDDLNLVVCAPEVPCGAAAQRVAASAGLELSPVSEEQSVTDVLSKVVTGEADAGLVYVTDVLGTRDVEGVELAESESGSAVNRYPIATIATSENPDLAQEFVDLVLSETGQAILADAGFARP